MGDTVHRRQHAGGTQCHRQPHHRRFHLPAVRGTGLEPHPDRRRRQLWRAGRLGGFAGGWVAGRPLRRPAGTDGEHFHSWPFQHFPGLGHRSCCLLPGLRCRACDLFQSDTDRLVGGGVALVRKDAWARLRNPVRFSLRGAGAIPAHRLGDHRHQRVARGVGCTGNPGVGHRAPADRTADRSAA